MKPTRKKPQEVDFLRTQKEVLVRALFLGWGDKFLLTDTDPNVVRVCKLGLCKFVHQTSNLCRCMSKGMSKVNFGAEISDTVSFGARNASLRARVRGMQCMQ